MNMMTLKDKTPALLVIDVQKGFEDESYWGGNRNNKDAEVICGKIIKTWRKYHLPIFHIRHSSLELKSPLHPNHTGFTFNEHAVPIEGEVVITKHVNSAFIGTDLKKQLDEKDISTLVIIGLTTNHCVSTTTRMAANYGYDTYLISNATATFDRIGVNGEKFTAELMHQVGLAALNKEFATVLDSDTLLQQF